MSEFELEIGEEITYNFPSSPAGRGVYLGMTPLGYLAVEHTVTPRGAEDSHREVRYLNPARLCTIVPATHRGF